MRIGLDIDNVIADYDKVIVAEILLADKQKRNTGIVNPKAHPANGMLDWSAEEIEAFCVQNMERMAARLPVRRNCRKVMTQLLADGHELYLVTHRQFPHYHDAPGLTKKWLAQHQLPYTKLIFSKIPDKTEECRVYGLDVMVDDRVDQCQLMHDHGICCYVMQTRYNRYEDYHLPTVTSWDDLYRAIKSLKRS